MLFPYSEAEKLPLETVPLTPAAAGVILFAVATYLPVLLPYTALHTFFNAINPLFHPFAPVKVNWSVVTPFAFIIIESLLIDIICHSKSCVVNEPEHPANVTVYGLLEV